MKIGERIKDLRLRNGMSQVELSQRIGISKQSLYKYENSIITNIPSDKIELIADALNTSPSYLMGWTDEPVPYYFNAETAQIAEAIFQNPDLRLLFDASRNATPDDLRTARDVLSALKRKEGGNNE